MAAQSPELSVIIAAHNEGLLAQKTLLSVRRALSNMTAAKIDWEVICVLDKPTKETETFFSQQKLIPARTITIDEGDLSANRRAGIAAAKGQYIAIIDADDLCSGNWFIEGMRLCKADSSIIVHTHYSINFGAANILWKKASSETIDIEAMHNVQANCWDSALIAHRSVFQDYAYRPNKDGFGSEDWDFNMRTLAAGISHRVAPRTILFVRRKENGSEMDKQREQKRIVRPSELLALSRFRDIDRQLIVNEHKGYLPDAALRIKSKVADSYHYVAHRVRLVRRSGHIVKRLTSFESKKLAAMQKLYPKWLIDEWQDIHNIEKQLFPTEKVLKKTVIYESRQTEFASVYKSIADLTRHDTYDYMLFVPYLNKGGADLVAIRYANTLQRLHPSWRICVVATQNAGSSWAGQLSEAIDFIPYGEVVAGMSIVSQLEILARFLSNTYVKNIHIINSLLAYKFVEAYSQYIIGNGVSVYVSAFCEDIAPSGHVQGYIHTELPRIYQYCKRIFTDNETIIVSLVNEYGYDPSMFSCHYVPVDTGKTRKQDYTRHNKLVWAGRISFQKQPQLLRLIAERLHAESPDITIDVYGSFDVGMDRNLFNKSSNVLYRGPFDKGLYSLPLDDYDAFLYTSLYDGIPNIILEAANARVPIITPDIGGVGEVCVDGKTGYVINNQQNVEQYIRQIQRFYNDDKTEVLAMVDRCYDLISGRHSQKQFDQSLTQDILL